MAPGLRRAALLVMIAGCGDNLGARSPDAAAPDAAALDAAALDARVPDALVPDAPAPDAAALDAGADDAAAADAAPDDAPGPTDAAAPDAPADADTCGTTVTAHVVAAGVHVPLCSQVVYDTNPPTSGLHYPTWAKYKTYAGRVGRPFWVHDLEHGAIVVSYHCTTACDAEVAAVTAFLAARPADPLCTAAVRNRFVVTPDPELDVRFAVSAWGFSLRSACFDLPALGAFIDAHYAHAPENFCADGVDVLDPAAGFPPNCP